MPSSVHLRSLLVHLDAGAACVHRLHFAQTLGRLHNARVQAMDAAAPAPDGASYQHDEGRVRALLDLPATGDGRPVDGLRVRPADSLAAFRERALTADLLVLGQRDPVDSRAFDVPADFVEATAQATGRPCLVVPHDWQAQRHAPRAVLVAWKPTRASAAALFGALPLLQQAEQVHLVTWGDDARVSSPPAGRPQQQVVDALRLHGVDGVERHSGKEPPDAGAALLTLAAALNAELLVMGCYGHARARELVLGGATHTVLRRMHLPVLMAH
jgi:nucleotide-binding universal stress UspA family protein